MHLMHFVMVVITLNCTYDMFIIYTKNYIIYILVYLNTLCVYVVYIGLLQENLSYWISQGYLLKKLVLSQTLPMTSFRSIHTKWLLMSIEFWLVAYQIGIGYTCKWESRLVSTCQLMPWGEFCNLCLTLASLVCNGFGFLWYNWLTMKYRVFSVYNMVNKFSVMMAAAMIHQQISQSVN